MITNELTNEKLNAFPLISIVMPIYNVPVNFIRKSIDSVLKQSFQNFELIIINDGSTNLKGLNIINDYKDSRIRLIHNQHDFINSLNKGITESKGKYIARMDADDIMLPDRLQIQYEFMENHPEIDVCGTWIEAFGNKKGILKTDTTHEEIVSSLLLRCSIFHPTVIIRKSTICQKENCIYKYGYPYAEDYKLWTDLVMEGFRFANIPEVLLKYRYSKNQVTKIREKEMSQSSLKIMLEYAEVVIYKICNEQMRLTPFFNKLIRLTNDNVINLPRLPQIVYPIYYDFLH